MPERFIADYAPMRVSWADGVPLVTEVKIMGDGYPSIVVHNKEDSLRLMWARIEATQSDSEVR